MYVTKRPALQQDRQIPHWKAQTQRQMEFKLAT